MIKITYPDYYKKFKCVADKCTNTCCASWQVVIDNETKIRYRNEKSPIGDKLRENLYFDGEDNVFRLKDGRCPFLDKNNLCEIYSAMGEDALCRTCEKYPRFETDFGGRKELGLSVSCPTVAELILKSENFCEYVSENSDIIPQMNTIDPELYFSVMAARKHIVSIIRSEEKMTDVFGKIIDLAALFEELLCQDELYEKTENLLKKPIQSKPHNYDTCFLESLLSLEVLNVKTHSLIISKVETKPNFSSHVLMQRKLLEYYIYRYFSLSVFDKKPLSHVCFAVFGVCCVLSLSPESETDDDFVHSAIAYSREIEHSQVNLDKVYNSALMISKL